MFDAWLDLETIDDYIYGVFLVFLQLGWVVDFAHNAVDPRADEAAGSQFAKDMEVLAFAFAHDGRKHHDTAAFGQFHCLVDHLADCLCFEFLIMLGAMRLADAGE